MPTKNDKKEHRLTATQTEILMALGRFKFLTASQFLRLGITTDTSNLNKQVRVLRDSKLVDSATFGSYPKNGRLESFHGLTPAGRRFLLEGNLYSDTELPPVAGVNFHKEYFHRKHLIDFQVGLYKWVGQQSNVEILFFDTYFDRIANQKKGGERAKTKLDLENGNYLIADAIFMLQDSDIKRLYCVEVYNGKDLGRTVKQLKQHADALNLGSASHAHHHDRANRVLCVFEEESLLESVSEALHTDDYFADLLPLFLFKPLSEVQQDQWFETWSTADGRPIGLIT